MMIVLVAGCRAATTPPPNETKDLAMTPSDGSMQMMPDLSNLGGDGSMMGGVTINQIDTGLVPSKTPVTVNGLVLTGFANGEGHSKSSMKCEYDAYLQDPNGPAPSGIKLFLTGAVCTPSDGGCKCPYPPMSNTLLDMLGEGNMGLELGAVVNITGTVDIYVPNPTDAGIQPPQHEIDVTAIQVVSATGTPITPVVISDPQGIASFALNGPGFAMYEDMLVTIKPAAPVAAGPLNNFNEYTYAGAYFSGDYNFAYSMKGMYPGNTPWSSITGIAEMGFGGQIAARVTSDFVM
jgi:hypothetical protein